MINAYININQLLEQR